MLISEWQKRMILAGSVAAQSFRMAVPWLTLQTHWSCGLRMLWRSDWNEILLKMERQWRGSSPLGTHSSGKFQGECATNVPSLWVWCRCGPTPLRLWCQGWVMQQQWQLFLEHNVGLVQLRRWQNGAAVRGGLSLGFIVWKWQIGHWGFSFYRPRGFIGDEGSPIN
jgi:hypothetical protein